MLRRTIKNILRIKMTENIEFTFRENKWLDHVLRAEDRPFFCFKSYISSKCSLPKVRLQPTNSRTGTTNRINQPDLNSYKLTIWSHSQPGQVLYWRYSIFAFFFVCFTTIVRCSSDSNFRKCVCFSLLCDKISTSLLYLILSLRFLRAGVTFCNIYVTRINHKMYLNTTREHSLCCLKFDTWFWLT